LGQNPFSPGTRNLHEPLKAYSCAARPEGLLTENIAVRLTEKEEEERNRSTSKPTISYRISIGPNLWRDVTMSAQTAKFALICIR